MVQKLSILRKKGTDGILLEGRKKRRSVHYALLCLD